MNDIALVFRDMVMFSRLLLYITIQDSKTVCPHVCWNYLEHSVNMISPTVGVFERLVGDFTYYCGILR